MKLLFRLLTLAALGAAAVFAAPPVQDHPGERVASEDAVVRNFHAVDLGLPGLTLYRSASPVRDLVKGKDAPADAGERKVQARRILDHLKARGITAIVSLEEPEAGPEGPAGSVALEREVAQAAGLTFLADPIRNEQFKAMPPEAILAWLQAVERNLKTAAPSGGVLLHCAAGHDRTGLVVAYLRITVDHWSVDRAIAEMRALGHNWPKFSTNGGVSSWHEEFLKQQFGGRT